MSNPPGENAENVRPESKAERMEKRAENNLRNDAKPEDREALKNQELEQKTKEEKIRATSPEAAAALAKRGEKVVGDATNAYGFSPELIETKKSGKVKTVLPGRTPEDVQDLKQAEIEGKTQVPFNPDLLVGKSTSQPEVTDSANVLGEARSIGQTLEGIQKSLSTTLEEFKQEAIKSGAPPEMFESSSAEQLAFAGIGNQNLFRFPIGQPRTEHPDPRNLKDTHKPDPEHGAVFQKPPRHQDPGENEPNEIPPGSISGGAAPPPGGDEHSRWSDPDFDPDHGTVWDFVNKHRYNPEKNPHSPEKEAPDKPEDKDKEARDRIENKEKTQPSSGYTSAIYQAADGKFLSAPEVARDLGLGSRTDLLKKLTNEDFEKLGLDQIPKEKADAAVAARLESLIEKTAVIEHGRITPESGLKACDQIRETLRSFCTDIDSRNLSLAIDKHDGQKTITVSVHGRDAVIPGTAPIVSTDKAFKYDPNLARPVDNHSEPKLLEPIAKDIPHRKSHTDLALFTEQIPCDPSCHDIINNQFPAKFKEHATLKATGVYKEQSDRLEDVKKRVQQYNKNKGSSGGAN